jgi:hypothetical protein
VPNSLAPLLNDTKWDELRLAMYALGQQAPDFRVREIGADLPGPWDGEWYYHFRQGGYRSIEQVELRLRDSAHRGAITAAIERIGLPGTCTDAGFVVYGYAAPGTPVEYISSSSNKSLERTRER